MERIDWGTVPEDDNVGAACEDEHGGKVDAGEVQDTGPRGLDDIRIVSGCFWDLENLGVIGELSIS
jgi:hypothetical protein